MYRKLQDFFLRRRTPALVMFVLASLVATLQGYYGGTKTFPTQTNDHPYTTYNNYIIFKQSFFHLVEGHDLYTLYPQEHWDLYKYSPTFALLFGAFAELPDFVGLLLWNLINTLALFLAVRKLPGVSFELKQVVAWFILIELFTSIQSAQSNALIAAMIVLALVLMEDKKFFLACLCIGLTVYIKLFGGLAFALCLLYPQRWRMAGYAIAVLAGLTLLPLVAIDGHQLTMQYESWWHLLQQDFQPNSLSLLGVVNHWSGRVFPATGVLATGLVLFVLPFLRSSFYSDLRFRLGVLAMILLWMVVFNHKAESPTFVIAMTGIGIWYVAVPGLTVGRTVLVGLAFVFTSLSPTDLFPDFIQENFFEPWSVKAIPCFIIYFILLFEMTFKSPKLFTHE